MIMQSGDLENRQKQQAAFVLRPDGCVALLLSDNAKRKMQRFRASLKVVFRRSLVFSELRLSNMAHNPELLSHFSYWKWKKLLRGILAG